MSDEEDKGMTEDAKRLELAVAQLMEHFDSVQIFAIKSIEGERAERVLDTGGGCFLSRRAQVRDWQLRYDEYARMEARQAMENGDE